MNKKELKAYKSAYNNPKQWNQEKLLKSNNSLAKAAIQGMIDREKDEQKGQVRFK